MGKIKDTGIVSGWIIGVIIAVFALGALGIGYTKVLGPWAESVRRDIFEESRAHVTGTNQHLGRMLRDYAEADDVHKSAIREMILMEADTIDDSNLSPAIRARIAALRGY